MQQRYQYIFRLELAIIALLLGCIAMPGYGRTMADSLSLQQDESFKMIKGPFLKNIELSVDYPKLFAIPLETEDKAEAGAGIFLRNHFGLNFEAGYGKLTPRYAFRNSEYESTGIYGRIGLSYLYEYEPGIRLYAGAKYAESYFSDKGTFIIQNPLWNDYTGIFERKDLKANWAEIIAGSESKWKGNFYLGFIFRVRIMIKYPRFDDIGVYSIPGYGMTSGSFPVLNLYIKYLID